MKVKNKGEVKMKRSLSLFLLLMLFFVPLTHAQSRGLLGNVYASWLSVGTTQSMVTFPFLSRDIQIYNGSTTSDICINFKGTTITTPSASPGDCRSSVDSYVMRLPLGQSIWLVDYPTTSITLKTIAGATAASPVSVVVTY